MVRDFKNVLTYEDVKQELDQLFDALYETYTNLYSDYKQLLIVLNNIDTKKNKSIYTQEQNQNAISKLVSDNMPQKIREEYVLAMENPDLIKMLPEYIKRNFDIKFNENDLKNIQNFSYIDSYIHKRFYPIQKDIKLARILALVSYIDRLISAELNYNLIVNEQLEEMDDEEREYYVVPDRFDEFTIDSVINMTENDQKSIVCILQASQLRSFEVSSDKKVQKNNNKVLTDLMFTNHTLEDSMLDALSGSPVRYKLKFNVQDKTKYKVRILDCIKGIECYSKIYDKYKTGSKDQSPVNLNSSYVEKLISSYLESQYQMVDNKTLDEMGRFLNCVSTKGKNPITFGDGLVISGSTVDDYFNGPVRTLKDNRKNSGI